MPEALAAALIRLYQDALKSHVPPLTAGQREQRAQNDIARLLDAVHAAGLRLTLHVPGAETGTLALEEQP